MPRYADLVGLAEASFPLKVAEQVDLEGAVAARYPQGTPRFEWPVHAESGGQVTAGRVDLLVDLPDGFVLIDHKSFPGALALDDDQLRAFAGQASCYASAVEAALGKPCVAVWAHQPVVGVVVRVGLSSGSG